MYLSAGPVEEVLAGGGPGPGVVHEFLRWNHATGHGAPSYVAIGVVDGQVWLLAGETAEELTEKLRDHQATDAEIIELKTLH